MADLRFDPIAGIWVAIARRRRERPMEFIPLQQVHQQIICPFCRGNEDEAPQAIIAYDKTGNPLEPDDDPSGWTARIVPNKYPSLSEESGSRLCGPYSCVIDDGIQEVIIPSPRHVTSLSELSVQELALGFKAAQCRIRELYDQAKVEHLMLFMNCRMNAGASLEHVHFQLMGSPLVGPTIAGRLQRDAQNRQSNGEQLITSILHWELKKKTRILRETEHFVMLCPYASRFSFQAWIIPRNPELPFSNTLVDFNSELASLCRSYVKKLEQLVELPAYNLLLHLGPRGAHEQDHWFIEIFPRLNRIAGFELGTSIWVNPVPPETAARRWLA